jgi:hypothetical protein
MWRSNGQAPQPPTLSPRDSIPCSISLTVAPGTAMQRQAWTCLWGLLLAEAGDHIGKSVSGEEGEQNDQK